MGEENSAFDYITQKLVDLRNRALEIAKTIKRGRPVTHEVMGTTKQRDEAFQRLIEIEEELHKYGIGLHSEPDLNKNISKKPEEELAPFNAQVQRYNNLNQLDTYWYLHDLYKEYLYLNDFIAGSGWLNCMYSLGECYPHGTPPGNSTFYLNPGKYGFKEIPFDSILPGDLILHVDKGNKPFHALMFNGYDEAGNYRFNYSPGNSLDLFKYNNIYLPWQNLYTNENFKAYRYVGTPQDSINWTNEYNNLNK